MKAASVCTYIRMYRMKDIRYAVVVVVVVVVIEHKGGNLYSLALSL